MNKGKLRSPGAKIGTPTGKHPNRLGIHPGKVDRMQGAKVSKETGPSAPDYLPGKRGRR